MDSKFKVFDLLSQVYSTNISNQRRLEVEQQLEAYGSNTIQHIYDVAEIIGNENLPKSNIIKLQSITYLNNFIKKILSSQRVENNELKSIAEILIKLLLLKSIINNQKQHLQLALQNILDIDYQRQNSGGYLIRLFYEDIKQNGFANIDQNSQDKNGLYLIIQTLLKSCQSANDTFIIIQDLFPILNIQLQQTLFQLVQELISITSDQLNIQQESDQSQALEQLINHLTQTKTLIQIHSETILKFKKLKLQEGIKYITQLEILFKNIQSTLLLQVQNESQKLYGFDQSLLSQCNNNQIDLLINELKLKALKIIQISLIYLINKKPEDLYSNTNQIIILSNYNLPHFVNTLILLPNHPNFYQIMENNHNSNIVKILLDIVGFMTTDKIFEQFYTMNSYKIFIQIIIPFLKINEKEFKQIENDSLEFVNYYIDICSKQKSKTYKTKTAKLLESLVDNIDGLTTFIFQFCIETIEFLKQNDIFQNIEAIQEQSIQNNQQAIFQYISQIIVNFKLNIKNKEEMMDLCLTILSILSYISVKRSDFLQQIDLFIIKNVDYLLGINQEQSLLIKTKTCLMFSFYLDQLFATVSQQMREQMLEKIIQFLFDNLSGPKQTKILQLQCLDVLSTQISDINIKETIQCDFDNIINLISKYNQEIKLQSYFDFLSDFIKTHYYNFTKDNLQIFMQSIQSRIKNEIDLQQKKQNKEMAAKTGKTLNLKKMSKRKDVILKANIRINKCWNTIRFMTEHPYFSNDFLDIIEQAIEPLLSYLINPKTIDFDDDLLFCMSSILKKRKHVSDMMKQIFPHLNILHEKYKYIFGTLLETLNYYIVYGKDYFQDQTNLFSLFQMANNSMYNSAQPIMLSNNAEGVILYALILQNLDLPIIFDNLDYILSQILGRFRTHPLSEIFKKLLLQVFLSALYLNCDLTLSFLIKSEFLEEYFNMVQQYSVYFNSSYEKKLYCLAISNMIFKSNNLPDQIKNNAGYFLKQLIIMLRKQMLTEQERQKQNQENINQKKNKSKEFKIELMADKIIQEEIKMSDNSNQSIEETKQNQPKQIFKVTKIQIPIDKIVDNSVDSQNNQEEQKVLELQNSSTFQQEEYDFNMIVNQIVTSIQFIDEFDYFSNCIKNVINMQNGQEQLKQLVQQNLTIQEQKYFKEILSCKRINISQNQQNNYENDQMNISNNNQEQNDRQENQFQLDTNNNIPRRIIKVKRSLNSQQQQQ